MLKTMIAFVVIVGTLGSVSYLLYEKGKEAKTSANDMVAFSYFKQIKKAQSGSSTLDGTFIYDTDEMLTYFEEIDPQVNIFLEEDGSHWRGSAYHKNGSTTYCHDSEGDFTIEEVGNNCWE